MRSSASAVALAVGLSLALVAPSTFAAKTRPQPKPAASAPAAADDADPAEAAADDAAEAPAEPKIHLHPLHGHVEISGGLAALEVPPSFGYIEPSEANELLTKGWGNPPGTKTLGMILPDGIEPVSDEGWGVIITYQDDGHVSDEDAQKIDYADLLKDMQADAKTDNEERTKQGFEPIAIVGWAKPPRYDRATRKLYWAKELSFGTAAEHTLNYNIRVLGKEGVLNLNAVAGMHQMAQVEQGMSDVLTFVDFTPTNHYDKFDPKTGKTAAYGIAALVAGGVLAKGGFFKVLLAGLFAAKKLIAVGVAAAGGAFAKLFKRKAA